MPEKILGLDVGDVRVGVALSDEAQLIATPKGMFNRAGAAAERSILDLIKAENISTLVVGLPLNEDGTKNEQCLKVENFCRRLLRRIDINLEFIDEHLSTQEAKDLLGSKVSHSSKMRRSGKIDAVAAALILQAYLDNKKQLAST